MIPLPIRPQYPSPAANTFIVYSLHFCPPLTSICFGCGKSLKPSSLISDPPGDLVIVSFMQRQFKYGGEVHTRPVNVYFHCMTTCVRQKQPAFDPRCHCTVPHENIANSNAGTCRLYREVHWHIFVNVL